MPALHARECAAQKDADEAAAELNAARAALEAEISAAKRAQVTAIAAAVEAENCAGHSIGHKKVDEETELETRLREL